MSLRRHNFFILKRWLEKNSEKWFDITLNVLYNDSRNFDTDIVSYLRFKSQLRV